MKNHFRLFALATLLIFAGQCRRAQAQGRVSIFTVINTANSGAGSLAQAITDSNATVSGSRFIDFNIPLGLADARGVLVIKPTTALPQITRAVTINGSTQTTNQGDSNTVGPEIEIDGSNFGTATIGLDVAASSCDIHSLVIDKFSLSAGIFINGTNNVVTGCYLGTDATGTTAAANRYGLIANGDGNDIGGTGAGQGNVISGNTINGIDIRNTSVGGAIVANLIGTNRLGTAAIGNAGDGIIIQSNTFGVTVGGTTVAERNIIAGNGIGVQIYGGNGASGSSQLLGNYIGTAADGTSDLHNGVGVQLDGDSDSNQVGGVNAGEPNIIAFNLLSGVGISDASTNNQVRGNSIFKNRGLGIDLGADGQTPNDAGDADTGPNDLQNFPVLTQVGYDSGTDTTTISGQLDSGIDAYQIDVYANDSPGPQGNGQGQTYLGAVNIPSSAAGVKPFTFTTTGAFAGKFFTASATGVRNTGTSELGRALAAGSSYVVINTNDSGAGSLRDAIDYANSDPDTTVIDFNIPAFGPQTISPTTALPLITESVTIDGYSQPDALANTLTTGDNATILIQIDGLNAGAGAKGLEIEAPNCTFQGLAVYRFNEGIHFGPTTATGNKVQGCIIGTDGVDGTGLGNGVGIRLHSGASNNTIGGTAVGQRNIIAGNTTGVLIEEAGTTGNTVANCYIGTTRNGNAALANSIGVSLAVTGNTVGGATAASANVISGNGSRGVSDVGDGSANAVGNLVRHNIIGLSADQSTKVGNPVGVVVSSRDHTQISDNVIAGNTAQGVQVFLNSAPGADGIIVSDNTIGSNSSDVTGLGNGGDGIFLSGTSDQISGNTIIANGGNGIQISNATGTLIQGNNIGFTGKGNTGAGVFLSNGAIGTVIGGTATDTNPQPEGNLITANAVGVNVFSGASDATGNSIRGNTIEANTGLGIDLRAGGEAANTPTANDAGDGDTGNNNLQNYPVITAVAGSVISISLNSLPSTTFSLDFYDNATADASGFGEGATGLGNTTVTTNALGTATLNFTAGSAPAGRVSVTATNQTTGDSSEFSAVFPALVAPRSIVINTNDSGSGSLRDAIDFANTTPGTTISFAIPGAGVHRIAPLSALPVITAANTIIDGTTQPGSLANTQTNGDNATINIELSGENLGAADGLVFNSGGNTLRALSIINFQGYAAYFGAGTANRLTGCFLGVDHTGAAAGNFTGLGVVTSNSAVVGTSAAADRNIVSDNSLNGISVFSGSSSATIQNNYVGTNLAGTAAIANGAGIALSSGAAGNLVGGTVAGQGNLVSGNTGTGIAIFGTGTTNNTVQGNIVGLNDAGTAALPNTDGVAVSTGATNNTIGGSGGRNLVSGNSNAGVAISGSGTDGNKVQGNVIGLDTTGAISLANAFGVGVFGGAKSNLVGGLGAALRNVVSGNTTGGGIAIDDPGTSGNTVQGNYVGLDISGSVAIKNRYGIGIFNGATSNTVGGTTAAARNVASGNTESGISMRDGGTNGNVAEGNYCGTDALGTSAVPNGVGFDIFDNGAVNTGPKNSVIGGTAAGAGNLISGNALAGLHITGVGTTAVTVQGNTIGLDANDAIMGNGANGSGISIEAGSSGNIIGGGSAATRNLISGNNSYGIAISGGASGNILQGNFIGSDRTGSSALANERCIGIDESPNNQIGDAGALGNLLVAGEFGVVINGPSSTGNGVKGNTIGTNLAGTAAIPDGYGVALFGGATGNTIGSTAVGAGNLIAGCDNMGVLISGANGNTVLGNLLGTTRSGNAALGTFTTSAGIELQQGASNNIIGSTVAAGRNVIAGHAGHGIVLTDANTTSNTIEGNYIGVGADGTTAVPNQNSGILDTTSANGNKIGGVSAGTANLIANNLNDGVVVEGATNVTIRGNSIFANGDLGIDLDNDGVTANDTGDGDGGANFRQNFPALAQTGGDASTLAFRATLSSAAGGKYIIDIYSSPTASPSGNGEGRTLRNSSGVLTADAAGALTYDFTVPNALAGQSFSATATDSGGGASDGSTSEFGPALASSQLLTLAISPATFSENAGPGAATATVTRSGSNALALSFTATSSDTTEATVPGAGLSFAAGQSSATFAVDAVNDALQDGTRNSTITVTAAGFGPVNQVVQVLDDDSIGFTITPTSGLITTEAGGQATFTVRLSGPPTDDVTLPLSSSDTTEGTVSPASLVFTPANFATAQTVTVTGVDDNLFDGNKNYKIVTGTATSNDSNYRINPSDVSVFNRDNDAGGFLVTPYTNLRTSEGGISATFTVRLNFAPTANVTLPLVSDNPAEGTVSPASMVFTPANFATPQTATVRGVDDRVVDGNRRYNIVTGPADSSDGVFNNQKPTNVAVINLDNDVASFIVSPISGLVTTENGGKALFRVRLTSQPTSDVTISLTSSDTTEGTVTPAGMTFTAANFDSPQTALVTGVADGAVDGDVAYKIVTGAATSGDAHYNNFNPGDVSVVNRDNGGADFNVAPTSGLVTSEDGSTDSFSVSLSVAPTANVTVMLHSSDTTEGTVAPASLTFTPANFATPQSVTLTGVPDNLQDGDIAYTVVLASAISGDARYNGLNPADVSALNKDVTPRTVTGLLAWGYNSFGQLGDGTTAHRNTPELVIGFGTAAALAAGGGHSVVRLSTGGLQGAGYNAAGQLGDGTTTDRSTPITVNGVTGVVAVATGWYHTLVLRSDGTVWAWGDNSYGQLGDGSVINRKSAVQMSGLSNITAISAGVYHSMALKSDGTVWACGNNFYGQLGNGNTTDQHTAQKVTGLSGATAIAAGGAHSVALVGGSLYAWGWNDYGQLGLGDLVSVASPVHLSSLSGVSAIAAGYAHTLALVGGKVFAWGDNGYGQLGTGNTTGSNLPRQALTLANVRLISAGAAHNLAVENDGSLWSWGNDSYGSLGDGANADRSQPIAVPAVSNVTAISAGYGHSLVLGTLTLGIGGGAGAGPPPSVALSATAASASRGTVAIAFAGALDQPVAADIANYSVTTAGSVPLPITSVSTVALRGLIILKVTGLVRGSSVTVNWRGLRDAQGTAITDGSAVVAVG